MSNARNADLMSLRLTPDELRRLEIAAVAESRTVRDFVVQAASDKAFRVLVGKPMFGISEEQWERFKAALDAPPRYQLPRSPPEDQ